MSLSGLQSGYKARYDDVVWGLTGCGRGGCFNLAELHVDGMQLCLACGDEWVERTVAIQLNPLMRELLPSWDKVL